MNAPTAAAITSTELRTLLESVTSARVVDVRTPAEFDTAHIAGSYNVPLDVLNKHGAKVAEHIARISLRHDLSFGEVESKATVALRVRAIDTPQSEGSPGSGSPICESTNL
jgi:hypothetical protein